MKKVLYGVFMFAMLLVFSNSTFAGTFAPDTLDNKSKFVSCDQTFENQYLRFGKSYPFGDIFYTDHRTAYINNKWLRFKGHEFVGTNGNIEFTPMLKDANYTIPPNSDMIILAPDGGGKWIVDGHPTTRTSAKQNSFDYGMKYMVTYDHSNNYPDTSDDILHNECIYYSITWCGDGVKDNYTDPGDHIINEMCDPKDPNKVGWGSGGCSNSCEPVEAQPVCNNLTVPAPLTVKAPATKNVSCTATNATSIKIDCGNGQVSGNLGGNLTGEKTVDYACNYNVAGTYNSTCYVNDTITNNQCRKTLSVTALNPSIEIIKEDSNGFDRDGGVYDTQTVLKGDFAMFKIKIRNNGDEDLEYVKVTDSIAPNCAGDIKIHPINPRPGVWFDYTITGPGLHTDSVLQPGEMIEYRCKKENTQSAYTNSASVNARGVGSKIPVNDTDITRVKIETPRCISLSATPNAGTVAFTSNFSCNGEYADTYKIELKDASGNVVKTINSKTGSYNFTQAGNYTASCFINDKTTTEQACIKPIIANPAPEPSITVDKRDANPTFDRDGSIGGNDSQTVLKGDKARFKIRVTNNGTEDLKNIVLTDAKAPSCAGNVTLPGTKPSTFKGFRTGGEGNHNDSYLQPGEWFEYTCEKTNTTADYTNTVGVAAKGKVSDTLVSADDPTDIKVVEGVCTNLVVNSFKEIGENGFLSRFNCTGDNVDTYKILVKDNSGGILETINSNVGQYFFDVVGNYSVECFVNNQSTTPEVCKKPVEVTPETTPSIKLTKLDANPEGDIDGQVGDDIQTVANGEKAVFRIIVENNGSEDLDNIRLIDTVAPNCAGSVTLPNTFPSTFGDFSISGAGDHSDAILQPGEIFEYTCEKPNTTADYTNSATVEAESTVDDEEVDSTDITEVKTGVYDLALLKKVINPQASYNKDDVVEFEIEVHNQGTIDATDVVVTDYIPSELELNDVSWTKVGNTATRNIGNVAAGQMKTVTITFTIIVADADIINWAEISGTGDSYVDCDSIPDSDQTNDTYTTDNLIGTSCDDTNGDEDDHDPATITVKPLEPSILIEKYSNNLDETIDLDGNIEDSNDNDSQTLEEGVTAKFTIKVTNNGNEDLVDVEVTDILDGTQYSSCNKVIGDLAIGEVHTYTCEKSDTTKDYTNVAKVTAKGKESNTPVTDEDDTKVVLKPVVHKCDSLTASQVSGKVSFTSDFTCTSTTGTSYKIDVKDASGNVVYTTNTATGSYTFSTKGDYSATCYVDGETTQANNACTKDISATTGGGGTNTKCTSSNLESVFGNVVEVVKDARNNVRNIYYSGTGAEVDVTCNGFAEKSIIVDCGNGTQAQAQNSVGPAEFTCKYDILGGSEVFDIECRVSKNENQGTDINSSAYVGSEYCTNKVKVGETGGGGKGGGGSDPHCGDGYVDLRFEQCDLGTLHNGPNSSCSSTCELNVLVSPSCTNSKKYYDENPLECDTFTYPSGGDILFGDAGTALVGDNVNPFAVREVFLTNNGNEEIYLGDNFCVYNTESGNRVFKNQKQKECKTGSVDWIFPGDIYTFTPDFVSQTDLIPSGSTQYTNTFAISLEGYAESYFAENVDVTVSKPTLISRGGGTTYLADNTGDDTIANVNDLAATQDPTTTNQDQTNFVATVLGEGSDLSNVDTITGALQDEAEDEGTQYSSGVVAVVPVAPAPAIKDTGNLSAFGSYRGIANVHYVEKTDITLGAENFSSTEPQTYIIQNGDLILTGNITSLKNIAFIVKGGDIIIDKDVNHLDGTYIAIGGAIGSTGKTSNQLEVNGSLYGDLSQLVGSRTYIAQEVDGSIGVGTLISFGSSVLNKPAPLIGQFIGEYMDAAKIAK